jgi:CDP-diacylglycerol--glycerol-3-phosphate 3-phosphatidyltransferase
VILLFVFSDLLDGTMARLSGRSGPWGAFLDSTLDRVADARRSLGASPWGFATPATTGGHRVALGCLVGGARRLLRQGPRRGARRRVQRRHRRAHRAADPRRASALVLYGFGVPYVLPIALWVLLVLTWITVGQRIWHVRKQLLRTTPVEGGDA